MGALDVTMAEIESHRSTEKHILVTITSNNTNRQLPSAPGYDASLDVMTPFCIEPTGFCTKLGHLTDFSER